MRSTSGQHTTSKRSASGQNAVRTRSASGQVAVRTRSADGRQVADKRQGCGHRTVGTRSAHGQHTTSRWPGHGERMQPAALGIGDTNAALEHLVDHLKLKQPCMTLWLAGMHMCIACDPTQSSLQPRPAETRVQRGTQIARRSAPFPPFRVTGFRGAASFLRTPRQNRGSRAGPCPPARPPSRGTPPPSPQTPPPAAACGALFRCVCGGHTRTSCTAG